MNEEFNNMPTFLEELQMFLEKLNEAFPEAVQTERRHNITLDDSGHLEITVWHFDSQGKLGSYFANLDGEHDMFQSMDDVIIDLRKYIEQNTK
ncbi:MAG: hypothetical protein KGI25_02940 [Thaumarchaeota archaeon]|nr:hypothetical protein [Nitrososphaerota archaeon]